MLYDLMMIDPPWPQKKIPRRVRPNQKEALDYQTMSIGDIGRVLDREVFPQLSSAGSTIFLWAIDRFLREAEDLMRDRGFKRHVRLIWDKGNGPAAAYTVRFSHEYLLWCYRSPFRRPVGDRRGRYRTVIQSPGRQHSRKPDEAYDMVADMFPDARRLDVFSRESRRGWDSWGDETGVLDGGGD